MFRAAIQIVDSFHRVAEAARKACFKNFANAAASIRKDAIASILTWHEPSRPGTPPHTDRGHLKRAIRFAADERGAIIGPVATVVGDAGAAHEFGGEFRGQQYPARPFMRPALDRALSRFAGDWRGTIGE